MAYISSLAASRNTAFVGLARRAQDRAHVVATQVLQVIRAALRDWPHDHDMIIATARAEIIEVLRDEFGDITRTTVNEIRTVCD